MAFENEYSFDLLVNEAERLVIKELGKRLSEFDADNICVCEDCVLDMAALALNTVKPLYRVSLLGSLYAAHAADEESYMDSIKQAVDMAVKKVSSNPSHD